MEEIVLQDTRPDTDECDEPGLSSAHCPSPRTSRLIERQDELTIQSYESVVAPLVQCSLSWGLRCYRLLIAFFGLRSRVSCIDCWNAISISCEASG